MFARAAEAALAATPAGQAQSCHSLGTGEGSSSIFNGLGSSTASSWTPVGLGPRPYA